MAESVEILSLLPQGTQTYSEAVSSQIKRRMRTKQLLKRVVFLVMPGSHSLELTGPYDAFATAALNAARQNLSTSYEMEVVSIAAGAVEARLRLLGPDVSRPSCGPCPERIDTLVIVEAPPRPNQFPPTS